jgi:multidrug efflux pump subunit AcrA (membrane-fusion protein)
MMKFIGVLVLSAMVVGCSSKSTSIRPERRDITQAVYASGKIYPLDFTQVSTKVPGIVQEIFVHEGDSVVVGQPLVRIKSVANDVGIEAARNQLVLARENAQTSGAFLLAFTRDVEAARARFTLDSINAARQERLYQQQATTRSTLDAARTQLTISACSSAAGCNRAS